VANLEPSLPLREARARLTNAPRAKEQHQAERRGAVGYAQAQLVRTSSLLLTRVTPETAPASCAAAVLFAAVSTNPPRFTTPAFVSTVNSNGRCNTSTMEVAMTTRRGRSERTGRPRMRSPGRPRAAGVRSDSGFGRRLPWGARARKQQHRQRSGYAGCGKAGSMPPSLRPSAPPLSGRYLSFAEREQIALLRARGGGVRDGARNWTRCLKRSHESCGVTLPRGAAASSIGRQLHNGMQIARPVVRSPPNWRASPRSRATR
jgi:hypothetical protein